MRLSGTARGGCWPAALEAEVAAYVEAHVDQLAEAAGGWWSAWGRHQPREVLTSSGAIEVTAPRVNDKRTDEVTGKRVRFSSAILPPWCRKSPKITEVLPLLYLHGLSTQDFGPALERFLGSSAGLSATTITRLTVAWQDEARAWGARDLSGVDFVYVWADGIHVNIRLDEERLCLLVLVGVRADGTKELIALTDGYRESSGSWADLLRDAKRLLVGDGESDVASRVQGDFGGNRSLRDAAGVGCRNGPAGRSNPWRSGLWRHSWIRPVRMSPSTRSSDAA